MTLNTQYQRKLDLLLAACRKHLRIVDEDLIRRAFLMAVEAHKHDLRASGEPYFLHPFQVAMVVAKEIALDDVSVAASLLHDVVEDTRFELKDIKEEFGETIADIVDGATKITDIFESHEVSQAENYRKLLLSMVNDIRVMLIKFADRLHNMRTLEYLSPDKQERMARETLDIYAPFAHRFGLAKIKWELEDLSFKYLFPKEYEQITRQLRATRKEREQYIGKFVAPVKKRLQDLGIDFVAEGRPKHIFSIFNKMRRRSKPLGEIYDLFAVRIVLNAEESNDCYLVYGVVSELYKPIPERFKDYISVPKKNGYRSIHTTVVGPDGRLVEVQIRTKGMHEIAEKGVAAHWIYKEGKGVFDKELESWTNWVREIFEHRSDESPGELIESFKLNLYQDEIYVFTPRGDLKILPRDATPVDFAYEIHSNVGSHCIGAKVNGRIVPLNTKLRSGDQVEIITSKNQNPNKDWEQFVVTHKAKTAVRKWVREDVRKKSERGKEIFDRKLRKSKLTFNDDELLKIAHAMKFENLRHLYVAIEEERVDVDALIDQMETGSKPARSEAKDSPEETKTLFNKFIKSAREIASGINVFGTDETLLHQYAKCCNPIPGDDIVGFITTGEGIKIHRKDCKNIISLRLVESQRVVDVAWPTSVTGEFIVAIRVSGEDRPGLLSDVTHAISTYHNTNIRSVNMNSRGSLFDGQIILFVKDTQHLERIVEKLRAIQGILDVERFLG